MMGRHTPSQPFSLFRSLLLLVMVVAIALASACRTSFKGSYRVELLYWWPYSSMYEGTVAEQMEATRFEFDAKSFTLSQSAEATNEKDARYDALTYEDVKATHNDLAINSLLASALDLKTKDVAIRKLLSDGKDTGYRLWTVKEETWLSFWHPNLGHQSGPLYVVKLIKV